jgi:hypothetical protein
MLPMVSEFIEDVDKLEKSARRMPQVLKFAKSLRLELQALIFRLSGRIVRETGKWIGNCLLRIKNKIAALSYLNNSKIYKRYELVVRMIIETKREITNEVSLMKRERKGYSIFLITTKNEIWSDLKISNVSELIAHLEKFRHGLDDQKRDVMFQYARYKTDYLCTIIKKTDDENSYFAENNKIFLVKNNYLKTFMKQNNLFDVMLSRIKENFSLYCGEYSFSKLPESSFVYCVVANFLKV